MVTHEGRSYGIDQNDALRHTDPAAWSGGDHHYDPPGSRNAGEFPLWGSLILDYSGYALILLGLIIGLIGFFRKDRGQTVNWSKKLR